MKFCHTLGAVGLAGGLLAYMIVLGTGPDMTSLPEYASYRHSLAMVSRWLLLPSLIVVLLSGLLSMAVHFPFQNAWWVWIKAFSGILIFEATLANIDGPARRAAEASARAAAGEIDVATLATLVRDGWGAWWVLLALAAANVALAIWRPAFGTRRN